MQPIAETNKYILENILVPTADDGAYTMGALLGHPDFVNTDKQIPIAFGFNNDGAPIIYDLAKMPHLLVCHGKMDLYDPIIASLTMRFTPDECEIVYFDDHDKKWAKSPNVTIVPHTDTAMAELQKIADSIPTRLSGGNTKHTVIIIPDIFLSVVFSGRYFSAESFSDSIQKILHHGAAAGIHLIAGATKPYESDPNIIDAFPTIMSTKPPFGQVERTSETLFGDDRACKLPSDQDYLIGSRDTGFTHLYINTPQISEIQAQEIATYLSRFVYKRVGKILTYRADNLDEIIE